MRHPARSLGAAWLLPALLLIGACSPDAADAPATSSSATVAAPTPEKSTPPPAQTTDPAAGPTATASEPPASPSTTPAAPPPDARKRTSLVVTSLAWNAGTNAVEASAFVLVVESDGKCALTLTLGSTTVTAHSIGYPDASSTSCDLLSIPRAQLSPGTWQAALDYESSSSVATNSPLTIEVP